MVDLGKFWIILAYYNSLVISHVSGLLQNDSNPAFAFKLSVRGELK
jgi:hypothetical protein